MKIKIAFSVILCTLYYSSFSQPKSSAVQSILIYSAIKYMDWPEDDLDDFNIIVVGESEIYNELIKVTQAKKIGNRGISIRKITSLSELTKGHLVFLCSSNSNQLDKLIDYVDGGPTLIVTEQDGFLEKGSDLNIVQRGEKVMYQVNEKSMDRKGIKVSNAFVNMAERRI